MTYYQSRKQLVFSIIYSQVLAFSLAVINVFYPQYYQYTFIVFFIVAILFMSWSVRKSRVGGGVSSSEIKTGRLLFKASRNYVLELQGKDSQLVSELKPVLKVSLLNLVILPVFLVWYWWYFDFIRTLAIEAVEYRFLAYLIGYEVPLGLVQVMNLAGRRAVKSFVQVIAEYEVYDKGIVGTGITLKFPLRTDQYRIEYDTKRMFVDLIQIPSTGKTLIKLRLYTKNPERLHEVLRRYALTT
ncbi:MAG: DUF2208 family protein [Desulfurococcaceae archaeon TW002]